MKKIHLCLFCIGFLTSQILAQGPLTPPGAPAPTMKTLEQVEPRTPISSAPYTITEPGSYYLTSNLTTSANLPALNITTSNVSIDLNGFSILGAGATANGVFIGNVENVRLQNGTIRDSYYHGIFASTATNCMFRNLQIVGNSRVSAGYSGINAGIKAIVEDCRIIGNNGYGLQANSGSQIIGNTINGSGSTGLQISGTETYVANNIVKGNADNYSLVSGNQLNLLLGEIPETLDWPCSVKFAGTLTCSFTGTNGITVNADNVTIDMNGHSLIGPGTDSGSGIYQPLGSQNLRVINGTVVNWLGSDQWMGGIYLRGDGAIIEKIHATTNSNGIYVDDNCTIRQCVADNNQYYGIRGSSHCVVDQCHANYNQRYGIYINVNSTITSCTAANNVWHGMQIGSGSSISHCMASLNGQSGIRATSSSISHCTARYNTLNGIESYTGGVISDCSAHNNTQSGISGSLGSIVRDCYSSENSDHGIRLSSNSRANGNMCQFNTDAGIYVSSSDCRVDNNSAVDNNYGIQVTAAGNIIIRNSASGNTSGDYSIAGGNNVGTIQTSMPAVGGPWDNFSF